MRRNRGPNAIKPVFEKLFTEFANPDVFFSRKQLLMEGDFDYNVWTAETPDNHELASARGGTVEMSEHEAFSDSIYEEQTHQAERELSSFIAAVTELYGPEEAKLLAEDWLDESDLMDGPPRSEVRNWRAVTIAASARLANRVSVIPALGDAARPVDN